MNKLFSNEFEFRDKVMQGLNKWFETEMEISSIDRTSRIDLLMFHKSDIKRIYPIGIELKNPVHKKGTEIGSYVKQSIRYSTKQFLKYPKILTLLYPQLSGIYFDEVKENGFVSSHNVFDKGHLGYHNNFSTFLGSLGVGEFQFYYDDYNVKRYRIVKSGKLYWDSKTNELHIENLDLFFNYKTVNQRGSLTDEN